MAGKKRRLKDKPIKKQNFSSENDEDEVQNTSLNEDISVHEDEIQNTGLTELVEIGKEQGFLTYEDINDMLPEHVSDPDQVEDAIRLLETIGIAIKESNHSDDTSSETIEDTRTTLTTVDSEIGRTTDPVRLYMREMGTVDLLTREGEIAIAKRIEEGARELLYACCFYPGLVEGVIDDYDLFIKEEKRITDVIVGFMDLDDSKVPSAQEQKRIQEQSIADGVDEDEEEHTGIDLEEVSKRFKALKKQFRKSERASEVTRSSKLALAEMDKLGEIFKFLKLSPNLIERIANPAREALAIIKSSEKKDCRNLYS